MAIYLDHHFSDSEKQHISEIKNKLLVWFEFVSSFTSGEFGYLYQLHY